HFPINASQLIYRFVTDVSPVTKSTAVDATGPTPVPVETSTFTYKVSTWRPDGTSSVDTFKVEERATRASASGPNIGPTIRTGDPARGLSLIAHVEYDAAGQPGASFTPQGGDGLLLLPLDVVPSEQFQSEASDPVSGSSYTLNALVNKRSMV